MSPPCCDAEGGGGGEGEEVSMIRRRDKDLRKKKCFWNWGLLT
jgi:hypothetical protein